MHGANIWKESAKMRYIQNESYTIMGNPYKTARLVGISCYYKLHWTDKYATHHCSAEHNGTDRISCRNYNVTSKIFAYWRGRMRPRKI